jgi:putative membrane protein
MLWLKALHVAAFAAWMAGLWYLPRLMIYHAGATVGSELSETLKVMERRLLRAITTPAMIVTLGAGLLLATIGDWWTQPWLHVKVLLVAGLAGTHGLLAREVRQLAADRRERTARWYRVVNEVPTVLFLAIVVLAVVQPF